MFYLIFPDLWMHVLVSVVFLPTVICLFVTFPIKTADPVCPHVSVSHASCVLCRKSAIHIKYD